MVETQVKYANLAERLTKVAASEAQGLWMLRDHFDADWKPGDEPHGTMTFTDQVGPTPEEVAERDKSAKRDKANTRALSAIKANKTGAPWGAILHDLAIAQGWIEPE